jgi:hypothetical protein
MGTGETFFEILTRMQDRKIIPRYR